jgi:protein-tyrosine-phosphatase
MKEIGVDIGGNKPKSIEDFSDVHFDFVITLCERANTQSRNTFEDSTHTFWDIADPNCFEGTEQEKLMKLRKVRTELFTRIDRFLFLNLEKNIKKVIPV